MQIEYNIKRNVWTLQLGSEVGLTFIFLWRLGLLSPTSGFSFNVCDFRAFSIKFLRTSVLFVGPLIPLFWPSGDVCLGFQSKSRSPTCVLPDLLAMDSSDSPLVQHLLTS